MNMCESAAAVSGVWRAAWLAASLLFWQPEAAQAQQVPAKSEPDLSVVPEADVLRPESITIGRYPTGCILETMPLFRGKSLFRGKGGPELRKYIQQQVRWPREAEMICVEGSVYAKFTIDTTGQVCNARIVKGLQPYFDAEALRVIRALPGFTPAKQGNKPVSVEMTVPVQFKIR